MFNVNELDDNIDRSVIPILKYFNDNGLPTVMSCSGHNSTNMSMLWVQFDHTVTEEDILEFQRKRFNNNNQFCSNGRFVQRVWCGSRAVVRSWEYMAATIEAAYDDLGAWMILTG